MAVDVGSTTIAAHLCDLESGEVVASFALTEPGAGSNPSGLRTKAVRDGDEWVITGQKRFITNAPIAEIFVVWAKDDAGEIRGYVLEKGMKGLSAPKIEGP